MKVLCVYKHNPDVGDGFSSKLSLVITEKHIWFATMYASMADMEREFNIEDKEIGDDKLYSYAFKKAIEYLENDDNVSYCDFGDDYDEDEYYGEEDEEELEGKFQFGIVDMTEEQVNNLELKEYSDVYDFVLDTLFDSCTASLEQDEIKNCFFYVCGKICRGDDYFHLFFEEDYPDQEQLKEEITKQVQND